MKSKFSRSNTTNRRVRRVEGERKPEKEGSTLGAKIHGADLGAKTCAAELGAKICGAEVAATLEDCPDLGATTCGAETCNLGATDCGADLLGPKTQIVSKRA